METKLQTMTLCVMLESYSCCQPKLMDMSIVVDRCYAENRAAYRFLVLKSDVLSCNTIVETKNVEFLENVFPLKVESVSDNPCLNKEDVNSYDDLRRSKRQRKEASFGNDFYTYLVENEPQTFYEAISSSDAKFWKEAIKIEIDSISKNHTWILVDLPKGAKPIGCKWIFKKKYFPDGSIEKYKARLVAKGFSQ